jgi:hypothetical protein
MFKECQEDNILMFPKKQQAMEIGSVVLSAREDGDVRIDTKGLSPREIRSVLCVAIQASYKFEENVSA